MSPCRSFWFLIFAEESNVRSQRTDLGNPARPSPILVEKASLVWRRLWERQFLHNKADLSTTDGINLEHKQEQRQSSKDARPARRRGQPTSRRRVRDCVGQHGRGGGAPRHQPTLAERVRTTHQANTTPPRDTTGLTNQKPCY